MTRRAGKLGVALAGLAVLAAATWAASRLVSTAPALLPAGAPAGIATEWYYAGGLVRAEGAPPRPDRPGIASAAREWIVLLNLSRFPTLATATFYFEDSPPRTSTVVVPGHGRRNIKPHELTDLLPAQASYGVRVTSAAPIIVQPTRGEYLPGDPVTAAMSSLVAYPGPLGPRETRWAYADGLVLSSADPLEEREWITILNPDPDRDAAIAIDFLFNDGRQTHALTVPAARVRSVDLFTLPVIPKNVPFGVVVASDVPVIVEEIRRVYRKGDPLTVSMFACLAHPIGGRCSGDCDADGLVPIDRLSTSPAPATPTPTSKP